MSDDDRPVADEDDQPATSADDRPATEPTMTDTTEDETERRRTATDDDQRDLWRTLNYALLAGLALLALIATLRLYFNVSSAINQWITYEYRSLFQAAFNLAVLLLVSGGMVWQVGRLRSD